MIYPEAITLLKSENFNVESRSFGIDGFCESLEGKLHFQIGKSSDSGCELSIWLEGDGSSLPGGPVRWFQRPSLEEMVTLLVDAQQLVKDRASPSLFDALLELDNLMIETGDDNIAKPHTS